MDKIIMKIILILVTTILFINCNQSKNNTTATSLQTKNTGKADEVINEVILSLQPNVFQLTTLPDTLNIQMANHTKDTITTGLHYRIELLKNGEWIEFSPKDILFEDMGFGLLPADFKDFVVRLFKEKVIYHPGKYRVVKYYLTSDYAKTKKRNDVYTEFKVE